MSTTQDHPATLAATVEHELVIKKSRFLAQVSPVADPAGADEVLNAVRKLHWDARHHCLAMITGLAGDQARSSDDGEPSGTAGVPILEVLKRRHLTDVVAVVSRWFGGTKLGAGGLVRAYSSAVSAALDGAHLIRRETLTHIRFDVPHAQSGRFDNLVRVWADQHRSVLLEPTYGTSVTLELLVRPDELDGLQAELAAASGGELSPIVGADRIVDVPDRS